jgi:hypothetical protein
MHDALGLTETQASDYATSLGLIPVDVDTDLVLKEDQAKLDAANAERKNLGLPILTSAAIDTDFAAAQAEVDRFKNQQILLHAALNYISKPTRIPGTNTWIEGNGGILQPMASGGIDPIAQMVKPNSWRVVGDRMDVDEAYIPLDGSSRSWKILGEALGRMPGKRTKGPKHAPAAMGGGATVVMNGVVIRERADVDLLANSLDFKLRTRRV